MGSPCRASVAVCSVLAAVAVVLAVLLALALTVPELFHRHELRTIPTSVRQRLAATSGPSGMGDASSRSHSLMQTYRTNVVPYCMHRAVRSFLRCNMDLHYEFFTDERARLFLERHYPPQVLTAFDALVAGAFRADLLRVAYLYIHGGWYADVTMWTQESFQSILERCGNPDRLFVRDESDDGVWQALLYTRMPGDPVFRRCLDLFVDRITRRERPSHAFAITGPKAFFEGACLELRLDPKRRWEVGPREEHDGLLSYVAEQRVVANKVVNHEGDTLLHRKYRFWRGDRPKGSHYGDLLAKNRLYEED